MLGVGGLGVLAFCFGCSLFMNNQLTLARTLLIAANVLIIPLFIYLIVLRSRASAEYRRRGHKRQAQAEAEAQRELAAQAQVDELLKANDIQDEG